MNIFKSKQIFITGGLGFIGFNLIEFLLKNNYNGQIIVYDNNSINNTFVLKSLSNLDYVKIIIGDLLDFKKTKSSMHGSDIVIHLAANSDISKGVFNPSIDFDNTIVATKNVLSAMLENEVSQIVFPSGSGVYGDISNLKIPEDYGPLIPVSHYGASKLSAEALISSFVHMHDFKAVIFRFANVIGPNQTHGVAYDFIRKIIKNHETLHVLGNGSQLKSYIHVDDIISGIFTALKDSTKKIEFYNLSTDDAISVKDIAELVVLKMGHKTKIIYGNTNYGWKGDVPKISLSSERIKHLGWKTSYNTFQAMETAIECMLNEISYIKKT